MHWILIPWFSFWRRFYGTDKGDFKFNRILCWAIPLGASLFFKFPVDNLFYQIGYGLLLMSAFYAGMSLVHYSPYWNMKTLKDWYMMAWNGLLLTAPVGLILLWDYPSAGVFFGLCGAVALPVGYYLGWKLPTLNAKYLNRGTEWGEVLSGALMGLTAAIL